MFSGFFLDIVGIFVGGYNRSTYCRGAWCSCSGTFWWSP